MLLTVYLLDVPKICFSRDGAYEVCVFLSGCLGSETCDNGQTASVLTSQTSYVGV